MTTALFSSEQVAAAEAVELDLAEFRGAIEKPATTTFHGYEINKAGAWNQGPVMLMALAGCSRDEDGAGLPQPRRYPGINWIGVQTLYLREVRRFWKVGAQTVAAPAPGCGPCENPAAPIRARWRNRPRR